MTMPRRLIGAMIPLFVVGTVLGTGELLRADPPALNPLDPPPA